MSKYLTQHDTHHFIPMVLRQTTGRDGETIRVYRPIVHNLIFIRVDQGLEQLRETLKGCPFTYSIYRKYGNSEQWCEISDEEMADLRLICDLGYQDTAFASREEYELSIGSFVRVTHGPMKGLKGKVVRKKKKYYLMRPIGELAFMVCVSRWMCKPLEEER